MVSCIVTIFGLSVVVSKASSVILFLIPFILSWIILKSLGLVVGSPEVEELVEEEEDEGDVEEEDEGDVEDEDVEGEEVVDGDGGGEVEDDVGEGGSLSVVVVVADDESEVRERSLLVLVSWSV